MNDQPSPSGLRPDQRQRPAFAQATADRLAAALMAQDAREAAALRLRQSVRPEAGRQEGALTEFVTDAMIPKSPLDWATIALGGPLSRGVKTGILAAGGVLESDAAQAGTGGLIRNAAEGARARLARLLSATPEQTLASKSPNIYNPPPKPLRPFEADYPGGAPADAAGRLTQDIEGRPLGARWVVGRNVVGGTDEAFPAAQLNALTEASTGALPKVIPAGKTDFGRTVLSVGGRPVSVELRAGMRPDKAIMVHAHENGHVIDQIAGLVSTKGISKELRGIYNTLNNPNRAAGGFEAAPWGKPFTPQALGYKGEEIPREYIVEAIRAYLTNPNYIKTVAPNTAKAIRNAVNAHPELSKIIQFNSFGGLGLFAPLAGSPLIEALKKQPVQ